MTGRWPDALASGDLLPVQLTPDLIELGQLPALHSCVGLSEQEAKLTANQRGALNTRAVWGVSKGTLAWGSPTATDHCA